jgi:hypothetical protein
VSFLGDPPEFCFSRILFNMFLMRMCDSFWSFKTTVAMLKYLTKVVRYYSRVFNVWDPNPVPELLKVAGSGFSGCPIWKTGRIRNLGWPDLEQHSDRVPNAMFKVLCIRGSGTSEAG